MTTEPTEPTAGASAAGIADLVERAARTAPEATALAVTAERVPVSYADLMRLVDDLARQLTRGGLRPGDRVALRAGSNAEFVVALLAASRADLVAVPLDPALPPGQQRARTEAAGARVVLVDTERPDDEPAPPWWRVRVTALGGPAVRVDAATAPNQDCQTPAGLRADDAMIMFTGGTTGLPKMVPWTRANIAASVRAIVAGYRLGPTDA